MRTSKTVCPQFRESIGTPTMVVFVALCGSCGDEYQDAEVQQSAPQDQLCPLCEARTEDVQAHAGVAEVFAAAESASIQTTTHLWLIWADVAVDRALAARSARNAALRASDSAEVSRWMRQEFDASLVAVAASAHALDALYGSTAVPQSVRNEWVDRDTPRQGKIREALKLVFDTGPVNAPWVTEFKWLFKLRDAAAHAREHPRQTVPHPLGTHTAAEFVDYSKESAVRAVDLMLVVIRWCADHPRPSRPTAVQWAAAHRPDIARLESRWTQA